tara:strand:- start:676 stop:1119 length:444 start_codon:yes stop_codon:yes gene_type:complete
MEIDEKDLKVLDILKYNSKLSTKQISKKLRIPITTIHNRIKKLEKVGVIKGYTVVLDYKKLNKNIMAYILVTITYVLPDGRKVSQENVAKEIKSVGAEDVMIVTGATDILIKVRAKDIDGLNNFIISKLRNVDGVDKTQTLIVLKEI